MPLPPETKDFLAYLKRNPLVRAAIKAEPDQTVVYCGKLIQPAWMEFERLKESLPDLAHRKLLPEIIASVPAPGSAHPNVLSWVKTFDALTPWEHTSFLAWRVVSGIMCANAVGKVSFIVGDGVRRSAKVFAATEVWVLRANPNIDPVARELVDYYIGLINSRHTDFGVSFIAG